MLNYPQGLLFQKKYRAKVLCNLVGTVSFRLDHPEMRITYA